MATSRAQWMQLTDRQKSAKLRAEATPTELRLHAMMDADARLAGKFKFQAPICGYFPDFSFRHSKLIVELDGSVHSREGARRRDSRRTYDLNKAGWRVIRFWNSAIHRRPQEVIEQICASLNQPKVIIIR